MQAVANHGGKKFSERNFSFEPSFYFYRCLKQKAKEDFATITRKDTGQKQVTYKGYPLYYFANDETKGDVNGQGVKNAWYTVNQKNEFKQ
ncbi:hypothetical protein AM501_23500 [Aneurinibacillus migulanus]|nr:hypothetical protein TS64_08420 [Aneurinibacillus migulanus]KPD05942.1 hypothetical protein AM501_23500 [Aneurinibacillus migulanus]